jgi:hypothetical protein
MKKIICSLFCLLLFSCDKETTMPDNTELWLKVSNSVQSMEVSFIGEDSKCFESSYLINYNKGVFSSKLKIAQDKVDGQTWTLIHVSDEKSDEIVVKCNSKAYNTRGFRHLEKRFIEVICGSDQTITFKDHDISIIEKIIAIE